MHDLLFGTGGAQIVAFCKQQPLQVLSVVLTAFTLVLTLTLGVRGSGSGDSGGISFGEGDSDGGCGGD
jgi:hypothetical protein